ncbi:GAP family protein, partial [Mycobacterium tuberculosis]|nr:GAP family protein [Mycobacterium tuberculosis]
FFLALAVMSWRNRPAPGEPAKEAKLLARVTAMSGLSVLALGLIEGVAIVKNVPLSLGAGARIAEDTLGGASAWVALVIYV